MAAVEELGMEYREQDWPHGLRCGECRRVIREGERYSTLLYAFSDDAPVCLVVCLGCATP